MLKELKKELKQKLEVKKAMKSCVERFPSTMSVECKKCIANATCAKLEKVKIEKAQNCSIANSALDVIPKECLCCMAKSSCRFFDSNS